MSRCRWLSLAVTSLLLFFIVEAPPHTVHHGLDHEVPQDCRVLATSDHTNGALSDDPSPTVEFSIIGFLPTDRHILHDKPQYPSCRSRAPPLGLSS